MKEIYLNARIVYKYDDFNLRMCGKRLKVKI